MARYATTEPLFECKICQTKCATREMRIHEVHIANQEEALCPNFSSMMIFRNIFQAPHHPNRRQKVNLTGTGWMIWDCDQVHF